MLRGSLLWCVWPLAVMGAALLAGAARGGAAPVFTTESALAALQETHPEAKRVDDALPPDVIAQEDLVYATREGAELKLDLYRPAGSAVLPAVLIVHGGGWIAGDRTMERPFAKQLAARGYVVAPVSYRLHREGRFPAPVYDLKEAVRWLRAHAAEHSIDPVQVGIVGASAGGTLAVTVGVTNGQTDFAGAADSGGSAGFASDVQAVVDIDGTVMFLDNRLIDSAEHQPSPYWEYVHGIYSEHRATWVAASPILYVSPQSAPTLFLDSTTTQPVLAGREEMAERLRILGVDTATVTLTDTPHTFWLFHPWFERVVAETDAFLAKHLKTPAAAGR